MKKESRPTFKSNLKKIEEEKPSESYFEQKRHTYDQIY